MSILDDNTNKAIDGRRDDKYNGSIGMTGQLPVDNQIAVASLLVKMETSASNGF